MRYFHCKDRMHTELMNAFMWLNGYVHFRSIILHLLDQITIKTIEIFMDKCLIYGSCVWHWREEIVKIIFVFFAHKYSRSWLGWTADVTWTILTMSLIPFWALNVSVALRSMQGLKALIVHQKYLNLCSEDKRSYGFGTTWGGGVIWHNFQFWVNYPFKAKFPAAITPVLKCGNMIHFCIESSKQQHLNINIL